MATGDNGPQTTTTIAHHGVSVQTVTGPLSKMAAGVGHGVGRFIPAGAEVWFPLILLGFVLLVYVMVRRRLKAPAVPGVELVPPPVVDLGSLDRFSRVVSRRSGGEP
jgi:hypothetical protein